MSGTLAAARGFEEDGEAAEVLLAELRERRHRGAGRRLLRVLQVVDLELDALPLLALLAEVGCAQVRGAAAEVDVARDAPGLREQRRALTHELLGLCRIHTLHSLRVLEQIVLLDPSLDCADRLPRERLAPPRALARGR